MDFEEIRTEISITGCVQLYRPDQPGHFIVVEQKLGDDDFIPLEQGAYAFFVRPGQIKAECTELFDLGQIIDFLTRSLNDGWELDKEMAIEIPKKNPFKKWQLSPVL